MLPSLNAVKTFAVAARKKSFKLAAAELNVSATAVSHQIRNLEQWLGSKLFIRTAQQVQLSAAGEQLYSHIHGAMDNIEQGLMQLKRQQSRLLIHTTSAIATWLMPRIEHYRAQQGELAYQLITSEQIAVTGQELSNEISLRFGDTSTVPASQHVSQASYGLYHAPHKADESQVFIPTWKQKGLTEPPWQQFIANNNLNEQDFDRQYYDLEFLILQQAIAGRGYAFLPQTFAQDAVQQGLLVQSRWQPVASEQGVYFYQGSKHKTAVAQHFMQWLQDRG